MFSGAKLHPKFEAKGDLASVKRSRKIIPKLKFHQDLRATAADVVAGVADMAIEKELAFMLGNEFTRRLRRYCDGQVWPSMEPTSALMMLRLKALSSRSLFQFHFA